MSYGELIKGLFMRSRMGVAEYAEAIDVSTTHLSNIVNGNQPGSRKILEDALAQAGMTLESLALPEPDPSKGEEAMALRWFRALTAGRRESALAMLKEFYEYERLLKRRPQKGH